ncbi:MAG: lysophospholipid acyltransferase family protein [Mariprofundaceae bacterium]
MVRSALFNLLFFAITPVFSLLVLAFRLFGFRAAWIWARAWSASVRGLLRAICGIRVRIEGTQHLPDVPCVVMAKHQSAMETVMMPLLVPPYTWVLKRELFWIPLFGQALMALDAIGIRRGSPREALRQVAHDGAARLKQGLWVVIFPEGTRSQPGQAGKYQPGGIVLAHKAGVGILPMAHNAGRHWPRRGFLKRPGTVTFRFLPFIPAEEVARANRAELLARLEREIEAATREMGG